MNERPRHPLPGELLQAALGDLTADAAARVQGHLADCQECLVQVEQFQETDREFSAYYHSDFKNSIPAPPQEWQGFLAHLRGHVTMGARWKAYLATYLRMPRLARALPFACAAILALVAVVRMSHAPVVSAGEILKKAAIAERDSFRKVSHAAVYQKLRVRVGRTTLTRVVFRDVERRRHVDRWTSSDQIAPPAPAIAPEVASEFQAAQLDWDDPLSPTAIQGWLAHRELHARARQEVREEGGTITVTSRESTAPVTEAQFVVRTADYHPISALYRFQDQSDEVEFTELAYEVRRLETLDATIRSELATSSDTPAPVMASGRAPAENPEPSSLESLEVDAMYALHQHHADVGGETEVTRQAGVVKVAGVVVSGKRKAELRTALAHLPDLHVELYTAEEAANRQVHAIASAPEPSSTPAARVPALREALAARFPDQASRDSFVLDVLDGSQQALAQGFALNRLTTQYPPANFAALSREARSEIQTMSVDHLRALRKRLDVLFERLAPLAGEAQTPPSPDANPSAIQGEQASLLPDLQQLDRIVSRLVSGSEGAESDAGPLVREYREVAGRLRQDVARFSVGTAAR